MTSFPTIQSTTPIAPLADKAMVFREGQVFQGKITKLFPENTAEVQVGNQKIIAKLETPLKAGDSYFLQVSNADSAIQLKVVTGPLANTTNQMPSITQLLDSLQLPKTPSMEQLVKFMVQNQLPLVKDQLIQAEAWLKALPTDVAKLEGLAIIQKMVQLKAPFTENVFKSLMSGQSKVGLQNLLQNLLMQLESDPTVDMKRAEPIKQTLLQINAPLNKEVTMTSIGVMLSKLHSTATPLADKAAIVQFLQSNQLLLNTNNAEAAIPELAKQLRQNTNMLLSIAKDIVNSPLLTNEQKTTMQSLIQTIEKQNQQTTANPIVQMAVKQLATDVISMGAKVLEAADFNTKESVAVADKIFALLRGAQTDKDSFAALQKLFQNLQDEPTPEIQKIISEASLKVEGKLNFELIEKAIKTIVQATGLSYESQILSKDETAKTTIETLKPQLLSLLNDPNISSQTKEAAEQIIHRMNGLQLNSNENGPQHQLLMQIPIDFFGRKMDATIQWNGRMKENGQIDSNYARILFYLDLTSMNETVIDMQVQNRVVTLNVFNEQLVQASVVKPFQETLKEGLSEKGYHLSGVFFKPFSQVNEPVIKQKQEPEKTSGVDFKV